MGRASKHASANLIALLSGVVVTVATVPLLLGSLGVDKYATWLVIAALPSYLVLSDFGIATAGSVKTTSLLAEGKVEQAAGLFRSYKAVCLGIVAFIAGVLSIAGLVVSPRHGLTVAMLCVWVLLAFFGSLLEGGFRATGHFHVGVAGLALLRILDAVAICGSAALTQSLLAMAAAQLLVRMAGTGAFWLLFCARASSLAGTPGRASLNELKPLLRPGLGFLLAPASQMILLQGSTLVAGTLLSAAGTIVFTAARTAVGIVRQIAQASAFGFIAEMTVAEARSDAAYYKSLVRRAYVLGVGTALVGGVLFVVFGGRALRLWTGEALVAPPGLFIALAVFATLEAVWNVRLITRMAKNAHMAAAAWQCAVAVVAIASSIPMARAFGSVGLGACFAAYGLVLSSSLLVAGCRSEINVRRRARTAASLPSGKASSGRPRP